MVEAGGLIPATNTGKAGETGGSGMGENDGSNGMTSGSVVEKITGNKINEGVYQGSKSNAGKDNANQKAQRRDIFNKRREIMMSWTQMK